MPVQAEKPTSWKAIRTFMKVGTCSETMCHVINRANGEAFIPEEHAALPLAGGILQAGYQCGLLWGAALACGAQAYKEYDDSPQTYHRALLATRRVLQEFESRYGNINCYELTETDWSKKSEMIRYILKGGTFRCFGMAGKFASVAFDELSDEFNSPLNISALATSNCAVHVARELGATPLQTAMASGFAGGIGLSGGGCGALGAALWLGSLQDATERPKYDFENPKLQAQVEAFLKTSGYEYECKDITGRQFKDPVELSEYLESGGCKEILNTLIQPQVNPTTAVQN